MHHQPAAPASGLHPLTRVVHPMFALYAGVLAGVALIFDLLYLAVGSGVMTALLYTVPVTAGLVACLVAAADELDLDRAAVKAAVTVAASAGLTNALYLATVGFLRTTGPADWLTGVAGIFVSAAAVLSAAVTVNLWSRLVSQVPAPRPRCLRQP